MISSVRVIFIPNSRRFTRWTGSRRAFEDQRHEPKSTIALRLFIIRSGLAVVQRGCPGPRFAVHGTLDVQLFAVERRSREPSLGSELAPSERVLSELVLAWVPQPD